MNNPSSNPAYARRDFLRGTARYAILGAIVGATATAFIRGRQPATDCRRQFLCGDCPRARDCSLPEAESFRGTLRESFL